MHFRLEPSRDLGLRHLLQNGLKIIRGDELAVDRRKGVLKDLLEIVSEADQGSRALSAQSLTVALDEAEAFEKLSLFFRYLPHWADELPAKLADARHVLTELESGGNVTPAQQLGLESLLESLLEALQRERAIAPLLTSREIHYH